MNANLPARFRTAAIAAAVALCAPAFAVGGQQYMVKVPISKLAELQGTAIEVTPSPAIFADPTALGAAAAAITVQVRNAGFSPITNLVASLASGADDFSIAESTCAAALPGMTSCTLTLSFTPRATGTRSGNLAVSSSAKNGLQLVPISGTGIAPDATLTAGTFSATQIRETSTSTLVLANPSTAALRLTPAPLTGDFSLAGGSCGATLALADWYQAGTITGAFSYRNDGNAAMTLTSPTLASPLSVASNSCSGVAPGSSCSISVALTRDANAGGAGSQSFTPAGSGISPAQATTNWAIYSTVASWGQTSLSFGTVTVGQTASRSVTQANNGSVAANWSSLQNLASSITANTSGCANVSPNGGTCQVQFTFAPTADQPYQATGVVPSPISSYLNTLEITGIGYVPPVGEVSFTSPGTYSWTVPAGVSSVNMVLVGSGGGWYGSALVKAGGGGAALGWKNNVPVTPGQSITIIVGTSGGPTSFNGTYVAAGGSNASDNTRGVGGKISASPQPFDGGGDGGDGSAGQWTSQIYLGGGGGAGGYAGRGGNGAYGPGVVGQPGIGGAGAGGGGTAVGYSWGGGGVGLLGQGAAGTSSGAGGSGGGNGVNGPQASAAGGAFGGGAGGGSVNAGPGAIRIIWGPGRSFPSNAN
jgi:hypothetical protein